MRNRVWSQRSHRWTIALAALSVSCDDAGTGTTPAAGSEPRSVDVAKVSFAASPTGLPVCKSSVDGQIWYVWSSNRFVICQASTGTWVQTNLNGLSAAVRAAALAPGSGCPAGGTRVEFGLDDNRNGALDAEEVTAIADVCNGTNGADGESSFLSTAPIPVGSDECPAGGTLISWGLDEDGNGTLEQSEATASTIVCNGVAGIAGDDGAPGPDGVASLIKTTPEPDGVHCPTGGLRIETGLDTNGNDQLDDDEITQTAYVCNGDAAVDPPLSCVPATFDCVGLQPRICDAEGKWHDFGSACADQACVNGDCVGVCEPGDTRCNGDPTVTDPLDPAKYAYGSAIETCGDTGEWVTSQECVDQVCHDGVCEGDCSSGQTCVDNGVASCDHGAWSVDYHCSGQTCLNAECVGECEAGSSECLPDNSVRTCDDTGHWAAALPCVGQGCLDGACHGDCEPGMRRCSEDERTWQTCGLDGDYATGQQTDCPYYDQCNENGRCVEGVGCVLDPANEGDACDDDSLCTVSDACSSGSCTGSPIAGCFQQGRVLTQFKVAELEPYGFTQCYDAQYADATTLAKFTASGACPSDLTNPSSGGAYDILIGCYDAETPERLTTAAVLPNSVLYTVASSVQQTNGVYWYRHSNVIGISGDNDTLFYSSACDPYVYNVGLPHTHLCWYIDGSNVGVRCGATTSYGTDYRKVLYARLRPE